MLNSASSRLNGVVTSSCSVAKKSKKKFCSFLFFKSKVNSYNDVGDVPTDHLLHLNDKKTMI